MDHRYLSKFGVIASLAWLMVACTPFSGTTSRNQDDKRAVELSLTSKPYAYTLVPDPVQKFPGELVERFEVRDGDCSANRGWSDCETDRERAEIRESTRHRNTGTPICYSWFFYLPPDWPNVFPTKTVLGQFHQNGSHPVWMFLQMPGGLYLDDQSSGRSIRKHLLISDDALRGRWHRVEVEANWAKNKAGRLTVWINDVQVFEHDGRTVTTDSVYFRYGVYRSFVSRYKNAKDSPEVPSQVAYFNRFRTTSSCAKQETSVRAILPPKTHKSRLH